MRLLPYFVLNIKSTRSIAELKELLNAYAQQKKHPLDSYESTDELEFSANGKNKFLVTINSAKWLAVDGTLDNNDGTAYIRLTFRQKIFTIVFQSVIFLLLLTQVLLNSEDRLTLILFLSFIYLANLLHFNWLANKTKIRLIRILQ